MNKLSKLISGFMIFSLLSIVSLNYSTINFQNESPHISSLNNKQQPTTLNPQQNPYLADIHSVETNITIDEKGIGIVSIIVNCTAEEGHRGIYLKDIRDQAIFYDQNSFAVTNDVVIDINFTLVSQLETSYLIYLENKSKVSEGDNVLYYIEYESNFYFNEQIYRYQVDSALAAFSFIRPIWDDALLFQTMRITLPIEVTGETIPPSLLEDISYSFDQNIVDNYNITFIGKEDSGGNYWFTMELEKQDLPEDASFQAIFYISIGFFSFPMLINWFVITLVVLVGALTITLFIVIISFQKRTKEELEEFKQDLYKELLKQEID